MLRKKGSQWLVLGNGGLYLLAFLLVGKLVGMTRSASLAVMAAYYLVLAAGQFILFVAMQRKISRADELNPFQFPGETYFWPYWLTMIFLAFALVGSFVLGWHQLRHPVVINYQTLLLAVLAGLLLLEGVAFHYRFKRIRIEKKGQAIIPYLRTKRQSELLALYITSWVTMANLLVLGSAHLALLLSRKYLIDSIAAMLIGVVLLTLMVMLGREIKRALGSERADGPLLREIYQSLCQEESIERVTLVKSLLVEPAHIVLAVKAQFNDQLNARQLACLITGMEKDIQRKFPQIRHVHIEPHLESKRVY